MRILAAGVLLAALACGGGSSSSSGSTGGGSTSTSGGAGTTTGGASTSSTGGSSGSSGSAGPDYSGVYTFHWSATNSDPTWCGGVSDSVVLDFTITLHPCSTWPQAVGGSLAEAGTLTLATNPSSGDTTCHSPATATYGDSTAVHPFTGTQLYVAQSANSTAASPAGAADSVDYSFTGALVSDGGSLSIEGVIDYHSNHFNDNLTAVSPSGYGAVEVPATFVRTGSSPTPSDCY